MVGYGHPVSRDNPTIYGAEIMKIDLEAVTEVADEIRGLIRTNLGRNASEAKIRNYFENGMLDQWIDTGAVDEDEAEQALDLAIEIHMESWN